MCSTEETVLLSLLPLFQKKLDVKQLQPYLKLYCLFSDGECDLICGPGAYKQKDSAAVMVVECLRRKSSLCCAQILLAALRQSVTKPGRHVRGHNEIISALQSKIESTEAPVGHPVQNKAWSMNEGDTISAGSALDNGSMNYFPSATLLHPSSLYTDTSHDPTLLDSPGEHTHALEQVCPASALNGVADSLRGSSNIEMVLSIGPSRDHAPSVEFKSRLSGRNVSSDLIQRLVLESRNIQSSFADLVLEVCSLLENSPSVYLEKLQMWLSFQNCTGVVRALKAFDSSSRVFGARSVPSLVAALRGYSSWYNYELIADVARKFCGSEGARLVEAYESKLSDYMQRVVLHCPQPFHELEEEEEEEVVVQKDLEMLRMDVDADFSMTSLKDLAIFKQTLCKVCDLDPRFVVLRKVDASSYRLVWAVPRVAGPAVVHSLRDKWPTLQEKKVKSVSLCGQDVNGQVVKTGTSLRVERSVSPTLSSIFDEIFSSTTKCISNDLACLEALANGNSSAHGESSSSSTSLLQDRQQQVTTSSTCFQDLPSGRSLEEVKPSPPDKTHSLGTSVQSETSTASLLSEISESLNVPDLLSCADDSAVSITPPKMPFSSSVAPGPSPIVTRVQSMLVPSARIAQSARYSLNLNDQCNSSPSPDLPVKKSVSFLWRVLGRAGPDCSANIHVTPIYDVTKEQHDDVSVRKGQLLKALYRKDDRIFVETLSMEQGFVPYSSCRIARKYYGSKSSLLQLSYLQLYVQSPDGVDMQRAQHVPAMHMVVLRDHASSSKDELSVKTGDIVTCLYSDSDVIYGTCRKSSGIVPQVSCELVKKLQSLFKSWQLQNQRFQSDFVIRRSEVKPSVLDENPVTKTEVENQACGSKVGKFFVVNQNFVPDSPHSSNFTIRKGLRVKVLEENRSHVCVSTKTGASFWIPCSHLRPARKNSDAGCNFQTH